MSAAIITAPTCRFKTKRRGLHIGIARADICADCLADMQASLSGAASPFCHECGVASQPGDLFAFFYRDSGALWMCESCSTRFGAKITSELDAQHTARQALIIHSIEARAEIAREPNVQRKLSLWEHWRQVVGPRRKV